MIALHDDGAARAYAALLCCCLEGGAAAAAHRLVCLCSMIKLDQLSPATTDSSMSLPTASTARQSTICLHVTPASIPSNLSTSGTPQHLRHTSAQSARACTSLSCPVVLLMLEFGNNRHTATLVLPVMLLLLALLVP